MNYFFLQEGTSENEARSLLGENSLDIMFSKKRMVFVGTVVSNDCTVYCYPKYIAKLKDDEIDIADKKQHIVGHLQLLNRVFRKLSNQNRNIEELVCNFNPAYIAGTSKKIDRYSLSKYIVDDYLKNGYFTTSTLVEGTSIKGRTHWAKTVAKIRPTINGGNVVYFKQIKQRWVNSPDELISTIHTNILYECLAEQHEFGNFSSLKVAKPSARITDYATYIPALRSALDQVYADREVYLLRALITWCQECRSRHFVAMGGTTNFQNVWEWVNDGVFGNAEDKNSSNPLYQLFGFNLRGKGEAKPDTLHCVVDDDNITIDVFDAKYYVPQSVIFSSSASSEGEVNGLPASSDVSKQIAYRYFIKMYCDELNKASTPPKTIHISNSFLIPAWNSEIIERFKEKDPSIGTCPCLKRRIGEVSIGEFQGLSYLFDISKAGVDKINTDYWNRDELKVQVFEVEPTLLYKEFLAH